MQEEMEQVLIYGAGGVALLLYAAVAWKMGRIGFGNRFLRFGRQGHVHREQQPGRFRLLLGCYVLVGCGLLAAAAQAWPH